MIILGFFGFHVRPKALKGLGEFSDYRIYNRVLLLGTLSPLSLSEHQAQGAKAGVRSLCQKTELIGKISS